MGPNMVSVLFTDIYFYVEDIAAVPDSLAALIACGDSRANTCAFGLTDVFATKQKL